MRDGRLKSFGQLMPYDSLVVHPVCDIKTAAGTAGLNLG
jgi:hypothetical protein